LKRKASDNFFCVQRWAEHQDSAQDLKTVILNGHENETRDAPSKVDIARFRLHSTTIHYDFSFDGYLHL